MENGKWRFGIPVKRRTLLLAFLWLMSLTAVWWFFTASYLELYVPLPSFHKDIWNSTSRTTFSYTDEPGVEYVLRRDGTAYTEKVGWQNTTDALKFFDQWLGERGWQRTEMYINGDPVLPETEFLKFGETFAVYTRPDDRSGFNGSNKGALGRVIVAVWPRSGVSEPQEGQASSFNVVVVTARPSVLRAIHDAIDD